MTFSPQDTQNILALIAIVTTFIVYSRRRIDERHDAARIILYEIEQAEDRLDKAHSAIVAAENLQIADRVQVMPQNSWQDLRKRLINVLPSDVIKKINQFYSECELLDNSLKQIDEVFIKNETEVRVNAYRVNADYFKERVDDFVYEDASKTEQQLKDDNLTMITDRNDRRDYFNKEFPTLYAYAAVKPVDDGKKIVAKLKTYNISQSRAGDYLRKNGSSWISRLVNRSK